MNTFLNSLRAAVLVGLLTTITALGQVPDTLIHNIPPLGGATGDLFGYSVAISGTRVVVGAMYDDTAGGNAGSAYVYDLSSTTPTVPVATLTNPSPAANDRFGMAVAISGTRVVIGAPYDDLGGADDIGNVYVYDLSGASPTLPVATLSKPGATGYHYFGASVAISGTRLVVGAPGNHASVVEAGSAYVYELGSGTPTVPVATLTNPSPAADDEFGHSVTISGVRVVVGAPGDDTGEINAGTAYVYNLRAKSGSVCES